MHWSTIIYCGIITYLTRFSMIILLKEDASALMLGEGDYVQLI